ncbi:hypothetical protein Gotri_026079 [Gossypium trilobum]|uniref:RNase H type-1 domain-containing protein n=1 Tax=Gossypium trilobum TaxID=34281 RepID=A0A7J9FKM7_9ROSI|nr:hypothetical protein [Gossypium trilobum]
MPNQIEADHDSLMTGNWIHLFTDGAVKFDAGLAASRGMACKQEGEWIVGFNLYLGLCTVFDAELWGVLDGITLIHERGYQKVMIHKDNLKVVKVIQDAYLTDSCSALLRRIHMSLQAIQHWKIKHVPRERNQVVDHLAKLATIRSTNMKIFEDIPEELVPIFEIDRIANSRL